MEKKILGNFSENLGCGMPYGIFFSNNPIFIFKRFKIMYKNFKITEKERQQILESHMSHGYRQPLNELGSGEIDLVRGKPDFKTKTGRPVGDYSNERSAARQFQQDFQRDFTDPNDEYVPYWEKDRPSPSDGPEMDTELKTSSRQVDREREERIRLRRRIASLESHKEEFGGDEELDRIIEKLKSQAREIDDIKF
jgi:hypothetical protein